MIYKEVSLSQTNGAYRNWCSYRLRGNVMHYFAVISGLQRFLCFSTRVLTSFVSKGLGLFFVVFFFPAWFWLFGMLGYQHFYSMTISSK